MNEKNPCIMWWNDTCLLSDNEKLSHWLMCRVFSEFCFLIKQLEKN